MAEDIIFIGLDVDDKKFHGCTYELESEERIEFSCRPTIGHLVKKLKGINKEGYEIQICYEATYLGYTLCRDLMKRDYHCDVIAPSLIPQQPGFKRKTDKIDSRKLAEYYANGQLTKVVVPDEAMERVRDLIRSRNFFGKQLKALKVHILSECRRCGIDYKSSLPAGSAGKYWTKVHRKWFQGEVSKQKDRNLRANFEMMLKQLEQLELQLASYDKYVAELAERPEYKEKVAALSCHRGIKTLTAMTLITEIGDIKRFPHPRKLTGYAGLDLREYTSGGKERRYGISKMGNGYIRKSVIEACQSAKLRPNWGRRLKSASEVDPKYVEIAERCMQRLYEKSQRLLQRDKNRNKVKVACAREMLSFVWETLQAVV